MSLIHRITMPVPALLRRYPELAGVSFPDTYRNDGVPLLLQDAAMPEQTDLVFPADFIADVREHLPRERRSLTAALSRARRTARLAPGARATLRLATRPRLDVRILILAVVSTGRRFAAVVETGPDAGRTADVVLGPQWPFDVFVSVATLDPTAETAPGALTGGADDA